jgi:hypothetical protein
MTRRALIACAMLFASPLAAQDINWQLDRINPGFAVQLAYDPGGTYTHRLRGREGPLYVIDSYFEQQQEPSFTVWVNARGNYVGLRTATGLERQYVPHDCKRTIGSCTYTQVEGTTQQTFTRVTTPDPAAGGYNYVEYNGDGSLKLRGFIALDAYGTAGSGFAVDADGTKTTYTLLGVIYPP